MKMLYLIRGIPGSGKSTYASHLKADLENEYGTICPIHEADDFFTDSNGNYNFDVKKIAQAHKECQKKTQIDLYKYDNVIVSNTFTTLKEMMPYIEMVNKMKIDFKVYRMMNEFKNKHNVPEHTILKMKERFEDYPNEILMRCA